MICVPFQPSLEPRSIHLAFTPVDKHPLPPKEPSPAHFAQPATVQNTHYHRTLHAQLGILNSNSAHFLHCLTLCNLFNCANFPPSPPSWLADDTHQLLVHSPVESLQSSLQKIFLTASASSPAPLLLYLVAGTGYQSPPWDNRSMAVDPCSSFCEARHAGIRTAGVSGMGAWLLWWRGIGFPQPGYDTQRETVHVKALLYGGEWLVFFTLSPLHLHL